MLELNLTRQQGDFKLNVAFSVGPRGVFAMIKAVAISPRAELG